MGRCLMMAVSDAQERGAMPERVVEVQRTVSTETVSRMTLDVPDKVLDLDDPDALTQWVELNVSETAISQGVVSTISKASILSADLV